MATQTVTGKAFEYALLSNFYKKLNSTYNNIKIIKSVPFRTAKECFESFNESDQGLYNLVSSAAVNFIIDLEPRLSNSMSHDDILQLEIVSDALGQSGDVRDVLAIRLLQNWEIGISAKNNHRAVKHSRLSQKIDFGEKWLGYPCSENYFNDIRPIFDYLQQLRSKYQKAKWSEIPDMHKRIYKPILNAFKSELLRISSTRSDVPKKLVEYLISNKDFYKIIKGKNKVEIQAFNLYGTLNQPFKNIQSKAKIKQIKLPNRLIEIVYDNNSSTTLIVSLNEGWQISFRIHNASSKIEPSLKFDINLISAPHTLFTNHIFIHEN